MLASQLQRSFGELEASLQVFPLQVIKLRQNLFKRVAGGQVFKNRLDGIPQPTDGRFAVANLRVNSDARQQRIHIEGG